MEETIPCPSCNEPLDLNATSCPVCLRGRSAKEIMRGIRDSKPSAKIKKTLGSKALKLFFLGGLTLGFVYFAQRRGLLPGGSMGDVLDKFDKAASTSSRAELNTNPEAARGAIEQKATDEAREAERLLRIAQRTSAMAPRVPAAPPEIAARAEIPVDPIWRVHGTVYDLLTLKPVAGARLEFRAAGKTVKAVSDAQGAYGVKLDFLEDAGYDLTVKCKGYGPGYLEEMSPPYKTMDKRRRQEERALLRSGAIVHAPLSLDEPDGEILHDIFLAK